MATAGSPQVGLNAHAHLGPGGTEEQEVLFIGGAEVEAVVDPTAHNDFGPVFQFGPVLGFDYFVDPADRPFESNETHGQLTLKHRFHAGFWQDGKVMFFGGLNTGLKSNRAPNFTPVSNYADSPVLPTLGFHVGIKKVFSTPERRTGIPSFGCEIGNDWALDGSSTLYGVLSFGMESF